MSFIRFSLGPSTLPASSFVIWCNNSCINSLFFALWNRHSLPLDLSTPFIYQSLPLSIYRLQGILWLYFRHWPCGFQGCAIFHVTNCYASDIGFMIFLNDFCGCCYISTSLSLYFGHWPCGFSWQLYKYQLFCVFTLDIGCAIFKAVQHFK